MVPESDHSMRAAELRMAASLWQNHHPLLDHDKLDHMHAVKASLRLTAPDLTSGLCPVEKGCHLQHIFHGHRL